jgi:hypothetical protein
MGEVRTAVTAVTARPGVPKKEGCGRKPPHALPNCCPKDRPRSRSMVGGAGPSEEGENRGIREFGPTSVRLSV